MIKSIKESGVIIIKHRIIIGAMAVGLLLGTATPTVVMASDVGEDSSQFQASVVENQDTDTVTVHNLLSGYHYTMQEENRLTSNLINELCSQLPYLILARSNSRYFTIHRDLTPKQVKKIVRSTNAPGAIIQILGLTNMAVGIYGALYNMYYNKFSMAASHNWGIRMTIKSDKYNPTSTGTTFSVSYIK